MQQFKIIRNERKGKFNLEISSDFNAKKKKKKKVIVLRRFSGRWNWSFFVAVTEQ